MIRDKISPKKLFASIDKTSNNFLELISSAEAVTLNHVPFTGCWTAAQVASHVTKSNRAIEQALNMKGNAADRNPGERTDELRKMFLDHSSKFQSPEFIAPSQDIFKKESLVADFKKSIEKLRETGNLVDLSRIITLPAFGEISKLELLHFVLYHTRRHRHQLKNILQIAGKKIVDNAQAD